MPPGIYGLVIINSSLTLVNINNPLTNNYSINGDLNIQGGNLNLNGNAIHVTGNVNLSGGTIDLSGGELDIDGSLIQTGGTLNVDGGYLVVSGDYTLQNYSNLKMTNDDDYIYVGGNFTTSTSSNESGDLTAGTLEIAGDFTQNGGAYSFAASGSNEVILSGSRTQSIYFANPGTSYFNNVDTSDSAGVKCNYNVNYDIATALNYVSGLSSIEDVISALEKLGITEIYSYINNCFNTLINNMNLQYLTKTDVAYFIHGLLASVDSNVLMGATQAALSLLGYNQPEDNHYYMLGKVIGDGMFLSTFLVASGVSAADAVTSLGAAAGLGTLGLLTAETGVGFAVFETAAGAELVEAAGATIVAAVAGAGAEHSKGVLSSDSEKLNNATDGGSNASSSILRQNMINEGVEVPDYPNAAHHIVAGNDRRAAGLRNILEKYGIDINSADNGVFLPTEKGVSEATYHRGLHTNNYYKNVERLFQGVSSKEEAIEVLQNIREQLIEGNFPY